MKSQPTHASLYRKRRRADKKRSKVWKFVFDNRIDVPPPNLEQDILHFDTSVKIQT